VVESRCFGIETTAKVTEIYTKIAEFSYKEVEVSTVVEFIDGG
jgi:hypothetical protein